MYKGKLSYFFFVLHFEMDNTVHSFQVDIKGRWLDSWQLPSVVSVVDSVDVVVGDKEGGTEDADDLGH